MTPPIAFTYDAAMHCPPCALGRFGRDGDNPWPPEEAADSEGNGIGTVYGWNDWCPECDGDNRPGSHAAHCETCGSLIAEHGCNECHTDHPLVRAACQCGFRHCQCEKDEWRRLVRGREVSRLS